MAIADDLAKLVPAELHEHSGAVFYSGRAAFSAPSRLYILGLNPGGSPTIQSEETIGRSLEAFLGARPARWSAYCDERWKGREPGMYGMQPRVRHLLGHLGLDPRDVPASNVVFRRSARESDLDAEKRALLRQCWPVHEAALAALRVEVVVCFGRTAGRWVRELVGARVRSDLFVETNRRAWKSEAHETSVGLRVLTLAHPSIADWTSVTTDPGPLIAQALITSVAAPRT